MIPLSLYIHIPWCIRKCPYCDFNSHPLKSEIPEQHYIQALLQDISHDLPLVKNRSISSIFFGGGTPSLFSPDNIHRLLAQLRLKIPFDKHLEITLEANPATAEISKFSGFFEAGINRLSLGVQSFNDQSLQLLQRVHHRDHAIHAIESIKKGGFTNFNLDLMFGLPNQTLEMALEDLKTALHFHPPHLSWYQLTIEKNTYFDRYPPHLPDEEIIWNIQTEGERLLNERKYEHYEVSAFTKNDQYCKHNVNYWKFGDYLGIGAGAHSKITLAPNKILRLSKHKHPDFYLQSSHKIAERLEVSNQQLAFEFMLNALRLFQGFEKSLFYQRTGLDLRIIEKPLQHAKEKGWIIEKEQRLMPTELGLRWLNELLELFLE
jgi:putative oxygen-independent coproporphyrinogen III oxidase